MSWILWVLGIVGFFYLVGKLKSKPEKPVLSITTRKGTVTYKTKRDQYLPSSVKVVGT